MSRGKALIVGIVLAWVVALFVAVRNYSEANRLKAENEALRHQSDEMENETGRLSNLVAQASAAGPNDRGGDLLKLRAEVTALRKQTNELQRLRAENVRMSADLAASRRKSAATDADAEPPPTEERRLLYARMNDSRAYVLGLIMHADDNGGSLATNLDQIAPYIAQSKNITGTNRFEIVYAGPLQSVTNPAMTILLREAEARQQPDGRWTKTYGFVDGHSEIHTEADGNFEEFEKQRMLKPAQ